MPARKRRKSRCSLRHWSAAKFAPVICSGAPSVFFPHAIGKAALPLGNSFGCAQVPLCRCTLSSHMIRMAQGSEIHVGITSVLLPPGHNPDIPSSTTCSLLGHHHLATWASLAIIHSLRHRQNCTPVGGALRSIREGTRILVMKHFIPSAGRLVASGAAKQIPLYHCALFSSTSRNLFVCYYLLRLTLVV